MAMAADEVASVVLRGKPAFDADVVLRRAVERCLEIMGEASKAMSSTFTSAHDDIPWSDVAKVRDRLSHHDHRVDPDQLWIMATVDVPSVAAKLGVIKPARSDD